MNSTILIRRRQRENDRSHFTRAESIMSNNEKRSIDNGNETKKSKRRRQSSVGDKNYAQALLNDLKHNDPVLRLNLSREESHDIDPTSKKILESILHPLSPQTFKSTCFRKKAVHIHSDREERVHDINTNYLFGLNPKRIFEETSSDSIFLWIPSSGKRKHSSSNETSNVREVLQSIDVQDPNTAYILHTHSNYASYCRAPPELEQVLVSSMLRELCFGLGQYDPTGKSE